MRTKIFRIVMIGVLIMSTSIIAACKHENANLAEKMLKEKYGEDFVVDKIGNSTFAANGVIHSAFCHPEDNDSILFELWINDDGTTFIDKYTEALIGYEMKEEVKDILSEVSGDYAMITDVTSIADGYTEGTRISEYNEEINGYVLLAINIDDATDVAPDKLYNAINAMYSRWGNVKGSLFLYLVDSDAMDDIKECISKSPRIDSILFNACGEGFISDADRGGLKKSRSEMEQVLY